jgi:hypothetical protein
VVTPATQRSLVRCCFDCELPGREFFDRGMTVFHQRIFGAGPY